MPSQPTIVVLLGAPGTGAQALAAALQERLSPGAVRILWGHDTGGLRSLAQADGIRHVLLMGLDLPCPVRDRPEQESADGRLRADLAQAEMGYRVVYGQGDQRLANALNAIRNLAPDSSLWSADSTCAPTPGGQPARMARLRAWNCEKCSDPECEHRLFTALTGRDARGA